MRRKSLVFLFGVLFLLLAIPGSLALAHQSITAGEYTVEYGWLSEPPIVGQSNAIVINVSQEAAAGSKPAMSDVDISGLKVEVAYGSQSKFLTLEPLGEDTPGQYVAALLPGVAGTYTLHLTGTLGSTPVQAEVQPEEVQTANFVQFPQSPMSNPSGSGASWLGIVGVVFGGLGTLLGAIALLRRKG